MNNFMPLNFITKEKDKFFKRHATKLHLRIDNLNGRVSIKEMEFLIEIFPPKEYFQAQMTSQVNSTKYLKNKL